MLDLWVATREQHDRVEEIFQLSHFFESKGGYAKTLQVFASFYEEMEKRLEKSPMWAETSLDFDSRRKLHLLQADLLNLESDFISRHVRLPNLSTTPSALGVLYVLEGSNLGGLIIARWLKEHFGPDVPCSFFTGYGKSTAMRWRELGDVVNGYARRESCVAEMISSAKETFDLLSSRLLETRVSLV